MHPESREYKMLPLLVAEEASDIQFYTMEVDGMDVSELWCKDRYYDEIEYKY